MGGPVQPTALRKLPSRVCALRDTGWMDRAGICQPAVTIATGQPCFGFNRKIPQIMDASELIAVLLDPFSLVNLRGSL